MPIIHNGTNLSDVIYNGVALDKVIFNGVTVFEKVSTPIREPVEGEIYSAYNTQWFVSGSLPQAQIFWGGMTPIVSFSSSFTTYSYNGWTYYRGSYLGFDSFMGVHSYAIYRIKN